MVLANADATLCNLTSSIPMSINAFGHVLAIPLLANIMVMPQHSSVFLNAHSKVR
jgi:hypothetical protein